ncbi:hypothetical protein [Anaerospora hongkongensis]|uniref:hypothetical protein n=1 Tax=Anaerospora hongkongensis TaxID=244830 RepID=UPI00289AB9C0|nr:hypothetical protein [Anaerospora hongkongensis]
MIDRLLSPRGADQPFIWFADYGNKQMITEFEDSGIENKFHDIDKTRIKEFGILGRGAKLSLNASNGIFDICGKKVEFLIWKDDDTIINLTSQESPYQDVINFKSAYVEHNLNTNQSYSVIDGFLFGYKHNFKISDNEFFNKIIFALPLDDTMRFMIRMVANKEIVGKLMAIVDGEVIKEFDLVLNPNEAKEIEWLFIC